MTMSRDLVNHKKKMVVVQNRCQKWKEHDAISKNVNFEATDVLVCECDTARMKERAKSVGQ